MKGPRLRVCEDLHFQESFVGGQSYVVIMVANRDNFLHQNSWSRIGGMAQVVECLLCKCEAFSSNSHCTKIKRLIKKNS
jgi:hypothetical protein